MFLVPLDRLLHVTFAGAVVPGIDSPISPSTRAAQAVSAMEALFPAHAAPAAATKDKVSIAVLPITQDVFNTASGLRTSQLLDSDDRADSSSQFMTEHAPVRQSVRKFLGTEVPLPAVRRIEASVRLNRANERAQLQFGLRFALRLGLRQQRRRFLQYASALGTAPSFMMASVVTTQT